MPTDEQTLHRQATQAALDELYNAARAVVRILPQIKRMQAALETIDRILGR